MHYIIHIPCNQHRHYPGLDGSLAHLEDVARQELQDPPAGLNCLLDIWTFGHNDMTVFQVYRWAVAVLNSPMDFCKADAAKVFIKVRRAHECLTRAYTTNIKDVEMSFVQLRWVKYSCRSWTLNRTGCWWCMFRISIMPNPINSARSACPSSWNLSAAMASTHSGKSMGSQAKRSWRRKSNQCRYRSKMGVHPLMWNQYIVSNSNMPWINQNLQGFDTCSDHTRTRLSSESCTWLIRPSKWTMLLFACSTRVVNRMFMYSTTGHPKGDCLRLSTPAVLLWFTVLDIV